MKQCSRCELIKEDSDFRTRGGTLNKHCNECLQKLYVPENKYKKMRVGHICPQCKRSEVETTFRVRKGKVNKYCDVCNGRSTQWKKENWSHTLEKRHKWLETQNGKNYKITTAKQKWRVSKYGITNEMFESLREAQEGKCAVCGETPTELCVDHDHTTGMVRGLLCRSCNCGMGFFKDKIDLLTKAIKYLIYWSLWSYRKS